MYHGMINQSESGISVFSDGSNYDHSNETSIRSRASKNDLDFQDSYGDLIDDSDRNSSRIMIYGKGNIS